MKYSLPLASMGLAALAAVAWGQATPTVGPPPPMPNPVRVTTPAGIKVETVASGLEVPWALAFANGGRILVTERPGRVRLIQNGKLQLKPYVTIAASRLGEGGLMGLALHPSFPASPFVYVMYTASIG